MTPGPVVCNASPLIALAQIQQLDVLAQLFKRVHVPNAVVSETAPTVKLPSWIAVIPLAGVVPAPLAVLRLGTGEMETLALALEMHAQRVILDDLPARKVARRLGLAVIGTLGILLAAKRQGLIPAVRPCLETLVKRGFHADLNLREWILRQAGEMV